MPGKIPIKTGKKAVKKAVKKAMPAKRTGGTGKKPPAGY